MSHTEFVVDSHGRLVEAGPTVSPTPADRPGGLFEMPADPAPPRFRVTFEDGRTTVVEGADAFQPEGHLVTFFASRSARNEIDAWSVRLASYRASTIVAVERVDAVEQVDRGDGERRLVAV